MFANNTPIPGMHFDLTAQEYSFRWKTFLSRSYGDYAYWRMLIRPYTSVQAVLDRIEKAEEDFFKKSGLYMKREDLAASYGELEDEPTYRTLIAHLERVHDRGKVYL
jgi:hypothetical protein